MGKDQEPLLSPQQRITKAIESYRWYRAHYHELFYQRQRAKKKRGYNYVVHLDCSHEQPDDEFRRFTSGHFGEDMDIAAVVVGPEYSKVKVARPANQGRTIIESASRGNLIQTDFEGVFYDATLFLRTHTSRPYSRLLIYNFENLPVQEQTQRDTPLLLSQLEQLAHLIETRLDRTTHYDHERSRLRTIKRLVQIKKWHGIFPNSD